MTRQFILKCAFAIIVAINIWGALPSFHYAPWAPLARDDVRVYTPEKASGASSVEAVPIARLDTWRDDPFVSTGQTVNVYIRSGYRNSGAQTYPRLTLAVAVVAAILSLFAKRRADQPKPEI